MFRPFSLPVVSVQESQGIILSATGTYSILLSPAQTLSRDAAVSVSKRLSLECSFPFNGGTSHFTPSTPRRDSPDVSNWENVNSPQNNAGKKHKVHIAKGVLLSAVQVQLTDTTTLYESIPAELRALHQTRSADCLLYDVVAPRCCQRQHLILPPKFFGWRETWQFTHSTLIPHVLFEDSLQIQWRLALG